MLPGSHPCEQYPLGKSAERRQMPVPHDADVVQAPPLGVSEDDEEEQATNALPTKRVRKRRERMA